MPNRKDSRVEFIHKAITNFHLKLKALGSTLLVKHGSPKVIWQEILNEYEVDAFYTNHDYKPYAMILHHFPHVVEGPFREKYSFMPGRNDLDEFKAWCEG